MSDIKTVLAPVDFSKGSNLALNFAKQIVKQLDGSLHLMYVDNDIFLNSQMTAQEYRDDYEDRMAAKLAVLINAEERKALRVEFVVKTGDASIEILDYAESRGVHLIVMGQKGRNAIADVLLGSTTQKVIHKAHCPVTAVPFTH